MRCIRSSAASSSGRTARGSLSAHSHDHEGARAIRAVHPPRAGAHPAFNVFVTTRFDSLLAQALDEERFGGAARTVSLAYGSQQAGPADKIKFTPPIRER
jgi:hypothetical protein